MKTNSIAIAVFAAISTTAAYADSLIIDYDYLGPTFDYTATLATPSQTITASPFLVNNLSGSVLTGSSFVAFCIEPFVPLSPSTQSPAGNVTYSSATAYNVAAVKTLFNNYYTSTFTPTEAAAFQFALWELVAETSLAPNLTNGSFAFALAGDPAVARGNQMLSNTSPTNAPGTAFNLFAYTTSNVVGDRSQDIITAVPVPEASTYAMMLAGLAVVGGYAAKRKTR